MTTNTLVTAGALALASKLFDIGTVDTVYRDVYPNRTRTMLSGVMSIEEFHGIEQQKAELAMLPLVIGHALDRADWPEVKVLSDRAATLRRAVDGKHRQIEVARKIYADDDFKLDPFSPGMQPFTRLGAKALRAPQSRTVENLTALEGEDASWKSFYAGRRSALQAVALAADEKLPTAGISVDLREAAKRALQVGDMRALAQLADTLITTSKTAQEPTTQSTRATEQRSADLLSSLSDRTLMGARRLGLAARRLEESKPELAALRQYAWNPFLTDEAGMGTCQDSSPRMCWWRTFPIPRAATIRRRPRSSKH